MDKFLAPLNEKDFKVLDLRLQIAKTLRSIEQKYKLSQKEMARRFELNIFKYEIWRNGGQDFNIRMIAKIEVLDAKLYAEKNDMIKITMDEEKEKK